MMNIKKEYTLYRDNQPYQHYTFKIGADDWDHIQEAIADRTAMKHFGLKLHQHQFGHRDDQDLMNPSEDYVLYEHGQIADYTPGF